MTTGKNQPKKTAAKPVSLYGMKPEDALRRALSTAPPNRATLPPEERAKRSLPKPAKKAPKKG